MGHVNGNRESRNEVIKKSNIGLSTWHNRFKDNLGVFPWSRDIMVPTYNDVIYVSAFLGAALLHSYPHLSSSNSSDQQFPIHWQSVHFTTCPIFFFLLIIMESNNSPDMILLI